MPWSSYEDFRFVLYGIFCTGVIAFLVLLCRQRRLDEFLLLGRGVETERKQIGNTWHQNIG